MKQDTLDKLDMEIDSLTHLRGGSTNDTKQRKCYFTYIAVKNYLQAVGKGSSTEKLRRRRLPSSQNKIRYLTDSDVGKLVEGAKLKRVGHGKFRKKSRGELVRDTLAIRLLFRTGMRISELLHLRKDWIDFSKEPVEIVIPKDFAKGKEEQVVYVDKGTADELKGYVSGVKTKYLFYFTGGDRRKNKSLSHIMNEILVFDKMLKSSAVMGGVLRASSWMSAHKLRHSFGVHLRKKGIDAGRIQELMRHKNFETTKIYLNIEKDELKEAYRKAFE